MFELTAIEVVVKLITEYTGYRKDRLKEDDILVRKRLQSEILKAQEHSRNILELLHEKQDKKSITGLKKVKDELDVFSSEVELSIMGHKYPFFTIQRARSPSEGDLKKLIKFDGDMLESIVTMTETMTRIETFIIDGTELEYAKEFATIRQYITKSRNKYQDREDFLRGWK